MAVAEPPSTEDRVRAALRDDFELYARNFLKLPVNDGFTPLVFRPVQQRLWDVLKAQQDAGKPMRAVVLKARKHGISTFLQGLMVQRATLRANHNGLTVAQDTKTAYELFRIGETFYAKLEVDDSVSWIKPPKAYTRRGREMHFGPDSQNARAAGDLGLNSKLIVDTANEFEAGRGFTIHDLHISEPAFYADLKRKLTSLMNTVPQDDPDTLIALESTANGFNEFWRIWRLAEEGESDFAAFFAAWFEDPRYSRVFHSPEQRAAFEDKVGTGPWGEDEPELQSRYGLSLEQLHWRRWAIENLCSSDLDTFKQEYPSFPEEAFVGTGRHVFSQNLVRNVREDAKVTEDQAERVFLEVAKTTSRRGRFIHVDVPTSLAETPWKEHDRSDAFWKVWTRPEEGSGHYVIAMDPASGESNTDGESAWHAIQVLDHKTRLQCAEWHSRIDPDLAAIQLYLMGMLYQQRGNRPLIVVEMTGGYGNLIADRVWRDYGWRNMYFREPVDPKRKPHQSELVGFSTDRGTKPRLEDGVKELLREGSHGIRSLTLANELRTYVRSQSGKTGPEAGAFSDLLMAYAIGQYVCETRRPKERKLGKGPVSTSTRRVVNKTTGW